MKHIEIVIDMFVSDDYNDNDIREWVKYQVGYNGSLNRKNPLYEEELDPDDVEINIY